MTTLPLSLGVADGGRPLPLSPSLVLSLIGDSAPSAGVVGTLLADMDDWPAIVDARAELTLSECEREGVPLYKLEARCETRCAVTVEAVELVLGGRLLVGCLGKTL